MYAKVITKEYFNYTAGGDISNNLKDIVDNLENLYQRVELKNNGKNLFQKPKNVSGLKFGYICPGAIKTVKFLNKNAKSETSKRKVDKIKKYTDALFFVEIIVRYKNYISSNLYKD